MPFDGAAPTTPGYASHNPSLSYGAPLAAYPQSPGQTLSYTSSPGPESRLPSEYGVPNHSGAVNGAQYPVYQMPSPHDSGAGLAGLGMASPQRGTSYAGSSAGGSEAGYGYATSSASGAPLQAPQQLTYHNPKNEKNPAIFDAAKPAPVQEKDAGPAAPPVEAPEPETLPPGYNAQWSGGS